MSFVVTFLIASVLTPTNNTNANDNTSSSASADGYTMTLSATSAVNLALSVSDDDTMTVGQGTVSVQTTSPGYRLYISMTGDTTGLSGIADGISGNIPATSGSLTSPISLTRGTWGYAIPSSGVAHLVTPNGFSSTYEEMSSTTPDTSKLFAVPPTSSSNPQMIASSTSSTSGDNYPIYYAVRANSATAPGEYSNKVLFTAVADAGTSESMTLTPSSVNINTATTVTVKTSLYSTAGYANANIYFLTAAEKNSISGTNVEALGKTPLACSKTSNTPVTYSCTLPAQTTPGTYYFYAKFPYYDTVYSSTFAVNNPVTLTVNPNGGTWNGSTSSQTFTQNEGTTKTISNPSANATYTISYNANGQGATYTGTPTSIARSFSSWSKSGGGTLSGTTYTFGGTNGTLTANYNTTSNSFTLPTITKDGYQCKWAKGSTSGTKYAGQTSQTITGNTTYYAVCEANNFFNITTMQEMTTAICSGATTPASSATTADMTGAYAGNTAYVPKRTLKDSRDGKSYVIKKLSDGKCWMTTNINIAGGTTLTSSTSNVTSDYTLPTSSTAGFNSSSVTSVYNSTNHGGYYNYKAATAGTHPSSGAATQDICPKNWKLPTSSQWSALLGKFGSTSKLVAEPFTADLAGFRTNNSLSSEGSRVLYWTADASTSSRAYLAYIYNDNNTKGTSTNSSEPGIAVRCIAK